SRYVCAADGLSRWRRFGRIGSERTGVVPAQPPPVACRNEPQKQQDGALGIEWRIEETMRASTLSEQRTDKRGTIRGSALRLGRSRNPGAGIAAHTCTFSADRKASASVQEPDPFMDIVFIEKARGT